MQPEKDLPASDVDDRRFWTRLSVSESTVTVRSKTMAQPAKIANKSFGGLALDVADVSDLEPEVAFTIEYKGGEMEAKVKRIEKVGKNQYRVACEWLAQADAFGKILTHLVGSDD